MILYGVEEAVQDVFQKTTIEEILESEKFMKRSHSFGGGLPFDKENWEWIINKNNGKLPVKITSLKDGSVFFPNEPVLHVENTVQGFGEFCALIEARLLGKISIATATATMCRHWLNFIREQVRIDNEKLGLKTDLKTIDENARFQIHNFGDRACSGTEESVLKGMAHLLSFYGTDSFGSAYKAWKLGAKNPIGTSILALAHRNVQSFNNEIESFQAIGNATNGDNVRIVSCVSDCFNYNNAVESLVQLSIDHPEIIWVCRPDSGDCFETIHTIFRTCINKGVYKELNNFIVPKNVRFIYGDSVKPEKQKEVMEKLRLHGMLPTQWGIWGIGGGLMTVANRDSLSSAYKLCLKGKWKEGVVKLSEIMSKLSIPFKTYISRPIRYNSNGALPTVFKDVSNLNFFAGNSRYLVFTDCPEKQEDFMTVSNRAIEEFDALDEFALMFPEYGLKRETLSGEIVQFQNEFFKKYRS